MKKVYETLQRIFDKKAFKIKIFFIWCSCDEEHKNC